MMFEALIAHAARAAARRADALKNRLAERLETALPGDVRAEIEAEGVRLSGRALRRRLALDPALKWTLAEWDR